MTDEAWDDDDFGTFESADASNLPKPADSNTPSAATPAWLLAAQQERHDQESLKSDSADTDDLFKELASSTQIFPEDSKEINKQDEHPISPKENDSSSNSLFVGDWKPFSENKAQIDSVESVESSQTKGVSDVFQAAAIQDSLSKHIVTKDANLQVEQSENEEILDLKGKLDNAIMLKLHTEKNLEELRKDLSKAIQDSQTEREKKEREHQAEIEEMKEKHEKEVASLKEESQKIMQALVDKYSTLSSQSAAEMQNENQKNIEAVVEKCLSILETQGSVLSEKLTEETATNTANVTNLIDACRKELKDFVQTNCDSTVSKCGKLKEEIAEYLKSEIHKEMEAQREIDARFKQQAMEELSRDFKRQLEETMRSEREKTAIAIETAVQEAKENTRKSLENEKKKSKLVQDQHVMALQMLLTSSQKHLHHLTESLTSSNA